MQEKYQNAKNYAIDLKEKTDKEIKLIKVEFYDSNEKREREMKELIAGFDRKIREIITIFDKTGKN